VDNLKGYMKSQEQIHVSNLDQALPSLSTIDEALGEFEFSLLLSASPPLLHGHPKMLT